MSPTFLFVVNVIIMKIIHSHVEGMEDGQEKNMDKIIKNVSKEVLLDKIADIK